ncbi:hypothetical protein A0H81_14122 [Grifola frondosa]|uniref:Uncharacterized protein n=1 Tax=Grifola frondosa TaxID=5627 RepID=A0A1C7LMI3_GRIFR|nr:hypothetical protein A0H81_14122 [Grifola frondosa]
MIQMIPVRCHRHTLIRPYTPLSSRKTSMSISTAVALGVTIGALVLVALAGTTFWMLRRRQQQSVDGEKVVANARHRRTMVVSVDPAHPAFLVTPFGAPGGDIPRFVHKPGENMRVAHRRSDGGWEFEEMAPPPPRATFDLTRALTQSSSSVHSMREKKLKPGELTTRGFVEHDSEGNPPPAYYPDDSLCGNMQCMPIVTIYVRIFKGYAESANGPSSLVLGKT